MHLCPISKTSHLQYSCNIKMDNFDKKYEDFSFKADMSS